MEQLSTAADRRAQAAEVRELLKAVEHRQHKERIAAWKGRYTPQQDPYLERAHAYVKGQLGAHLPAVTTRAGRVCMTAPDIAQGLQEDWHEIRNPPAYPTQLDTLTQFETQYGHLFPELAQWREDTVTVIDL
ncbi:MAG: hypothetical protein AAGG38_04955, partial [Planctomycetota bacterium]